MIGKKIVHIESCDSTNNYIANLISGGNIDFGTVILADEQTKGKGQRGSEWQSKPAENMIFSLYLDSANLSVKNQFILTQFVSVSLVRSLLKFGIKACIKWPNDIYVNGKKIAGVLIENQLSGMMLNGSIIGIGLNINQTDFGTLNATSVKLEKGVFTKVSEVAYLIINELNFAWEEVLNIQTNRLNETYLEHLWRLNEKTFFRDTKGEFEGIIRGTEESGLLRMERNGEIVTYDLKEISFVIST